jgi:glucose/arabinose dehydrogenase
LQFPRQFRPSRRAATSYTQRLPRPNERPGGAVQHDHVTTGNKVGLKLAGLCALLGVLSTANGASAARSISVPEGFTAHVVARDLAGACDLHIDADGTLRLRANSATIEIKPPRDDSPMLILRVATELDQESTLPATALTAPLESETMAIPLPISMETLALARELDQRTSTDVALSPDGTLYVADARAGVVYQVRRTTL